MKQILLTVGSAFFTAGFFFAGTGTNYQLSLPALLISAVIIVIGLEKK